MKRCLIAACVLFLIGSACGEDRAAPTPAATPEYTPFATAEPPESVLVHFDEATVTAEVAATTQARGFGLMRRTKLGADAGMLFLFPAPDSGGFWMRNTLIPLQIAFMRRPTHDTFEVLALRDMVPCKKDPCTVYDPGLSYDAALEVNEGWFDAHAIREGSVARVEGTLPTPE